MWGVGPHPQLAKQSRTEAEIPRPKEPGQGQSGARPEQGWAEPPPHPRRASTSVPGQGLTPVGWFVTTLQVVILKAVHVIKTYAKRVLRIFAISNDWLLKMNFESILTVVL